MRLGHFSGSLQPSWGLHSCKRWSNLVPKTSRRWRQMLINSEIKVWSFHFLPPSFSLLCRSRVWTASCGLLWTWNWTCRCLARDRPGWTKNCTCCGSWRPSWRRRGSRARESCRRGSEKTNASGSSSSRLRNRWVDFCLSAPARADEGITLEPFLLRLVRSSCRRSGWKRCWGQQQRTSTRSGARAARRSPKSRPSGERTVPVMKQPLAFCRHGDPDLLVPPADVFSERRWPSSHERRPASPTCRPMTCREAFQSVARPSGPASPSANEVHNWWSDEEF